MKKIVVVVIFLGSFLFSSATERRLSAFNEFNDVNAVESGVPLMAHNTESNSQKNELIATFTAGERRLKPLIKLIQDDVPFTFVFSGYVKNMTFIDSRQVYGVADNYTLFVPKERLPDALGNDINAAGQFNMLPIETRVMATIFGPNIGNAVTQAEISGDFVTIPSGAILILPGDAFNRFKMRHAYFQLLWPNYSFLAGHTWHPMTFPIAAPDVVSNNTGSPFNPYSRASQIRFTYHTEKWELLAAILSQTFFDSTGPLGITDTYARNSLTPDCLLYGLVFLGNHWDVGAGIDYKRLVPRLVTDKNYKTKTAISSIAAMAHVEFYTNRFSWNTKVTYAQNGFNFGMMGGYAVDCVDPVTDYRSYTNLNTVAVWTELVLRTRVEPGLFIGYSKNLGASKNIIQAIVDQEGVAENTIYAFLPQVASAWRVAPRVSYRKESFLMQFELECTQATYGTIDRKGSVKNVCSPVTNVRFLFGLAYFY